VRKFYWYFSSYVRKHGLIVLLTIILASIGFSFLVPRMAEIFDPKPRQYIGLVGDYSLSSLPPEIMSLVSLGLTRVEEDGTAIPELSERWSVEDEGRTYRFMLKQNLQWQDGRPLETNDLRYSFNDVEIITTPNDVLFKLPETFVPFPTVVSRPIFRAGSEKYMLFFNRPTLIGLGKYQVSDYKQKGSRLVEVTIESSNERRVYRFYVSENDAVLAFKRGEVDVLSSLSDIYDIGGWATAETTSQLDMSTYLAVFFNLENPLFTKNVRQALAYGIQKVDDESRASGPINPNSWAHLEGAKSYEYDLKRGVERLLSEIPSQPLQIELTTTPLFEKEAAQIKQDWEAMGIVAEQECQKSAIIKDKNRCANVNISVAYRITSFPDTTNFQALLIGQESPADPDQYYLWHSNESTNFSRYRNTRIDSLLEKGRQTLDRNERLALYQEFQQFFLEDAPAIFLRHLTSYTIRRN